MQLAVFDVAGRRIRVLYHGFNAEAGTNQVVWDGLDDRFRQLPSGTYFYRLDMVEFSQARAMVLLR